MRSGAGLLVVCFIACAPEARRDQASPPPAAAPADAPQAPLRLEARRRVSWGYGCGGNCAQNTRGSSTVVATASGAELWVKDAGTTSTTFSSPGSVRTSERTWSLAWRGTYDDGDTAMRFRLTSGTGTCQESDNQKKAACRHAAPARLLIACTRDQVEIEAAHRPVWRCQPDPPIPDGEWTGTPFPWIFGIDDPIDTIHAGEPQPRTSYQIRALR